MVQTNITTTKIPPMAENPTELKKCGQPHFLNTKQTTPAPKPVASQKLEQARSRIRFAQRSVTASEGRLLDYDTAEEIGRALAAASRDLEQLSIQVSVMERRSK